MTLHIKILYHGATLIIPEWLSKSGPDGSPLWPYDLPLHR